MKLLVLAFLLSSSYLAVRAQGNADTMGCTARCPAPQDRPWPPGEGFVEDETQLRCSFQCDSDNDEQVSFGTQCACKHMDSD